MITRLNPFLPVETSLGKGNAIFHVNSNAQDLYWVINNSDKSIRLFEKHEVWISKDHA